MLRNISKRIISVKLAVIIPLSHLHANAVRICTVALHPNFESNESLSITVPQNVVHQFVKNRIDNQ